MLDIDSDILYLAVAGVFLENGLYASKISIVVTCFLVCDIINQNIWMVIMQSNLFQANYSTEAHRAAAVFCAQQFFKFPDDVSPQKAYEVGMTGSRQKAGIMVKEPFASRGQFVGDFLEVNRNMRDLLMKYGNSIKDGLVVAALIGDLPQAHQAGYHQLAYIGMESKRERSFMKDVYRLDIMTGNWVSIRGENPPVELEFDNIFLPNIHEEGYKSLGMIERTEIAQAFAANHFIRTLDGSSLVSVFNEVMISDDLDEEKYDVRANYEMYDWDQIRTLMMEMSERVQDIMDEYTANIKVGVDILMKNGMGIQDIHKLNLNEMAGVGHLSRVTVAIDGVPFKMDGGYRYWVSQDGKETRREVDTTTGFLPLSSGLKEILYDDIRVLVPERSAMFNATM